MFKNPTRPILTQVIILYFFFCGSFLRAETSIRAKYLYEVKIPGPSIIEPCADHLWVYSVEGKDLWKVNPQTGSVLTQTLLSKLNIQWPITALGCYNQKLLAASIDKTSHTAYFHIFEEPSKVSTQVLQGKNIVRDIFCDISSCYLIRDKLYRSQNLKNWDEVSISSSSDIPKLKSEKEHYFSNWQDQFLIAKGSYFRGFSDPRTKNLLLLDSIRSAIVTWSPSHAEKWESWGFRRGNLLFPKGFAILNQDVLVISDVGLKLISFFNRQGKYFGSIGADGKNQRFGYPLDIAIIGNTLYSVDFLANKLVALAIEHIPEKDSPTPALKVQENLFRHPDVVKYFSETRCLNCHDGLQTYNLERFLNISERHTHPIRVEVKQKTKLPLWSGGKVDCFSCHQPHHNAPAGKIVDQFGKIQSVATLPYQLRKSIPELCLECHSEKGLTEKNHFQIKRKRLYTA